MKDLYPPGMLTLFGEEKAGEKARRAEFEGKNQFQVANAAARVKWLDEQGIAQQHVICLAGISYNLQIQELALRQEIIAACNTWLATTCDASGGRLRPVTALEYTDLAFVERELAAHARARQPDLPDSRLSRERRARRVIRAGIGSGRRRRISA